jgi:hypothetical protein
MGLIQGDFRQPILVPIIKAYYISEEVLDPREAKYVFAEPKDFEADMTMLAKRAIHLKDAPRLYDHWRICCDHELITELLNFNRKYREHLMVVRQLDLLHQNEIDDIIAKTDEAYRLWDLARDAKNTGYYFFARREALRKLRDQVGWQLILPPHVPIEHFTEIGR